MHLVLVEGLSSGRQSGNTEIAKSRKKGRARDGFLGSVARTQPLRSRPTLPQGPIPPPQQKCTLGVAPGGGGDPGGGLKKPPAKSKGKPSVVT